MKGFFRSIGEYIKKTDKVLLSLCIGASVYGLLLIYSATHMSSPKQAIVQSCALLIGLVAAILISLLDYEDISRFWIFIALAAVGLMVLTLLIGTGPSGSDNRAWIMLPGGISVQTSEILKIAFIITFSRHLARLGDRVSEFKNVVLLGLHALIPIALVVATKDDGTATVFVAIFICMMFAAGVKLRYFLIGGGLMLIAAPIFWFKILSPYQRDRFLVVYNPEQYDPTGQGLFWQQGQGEIALGSGQLFGRGLFQGPRIQGQMVPESHNDFILSVSGEELGFLGCMAVFLLLAAIFIRILMVGHRSYSKMGMLICVGIFSQLAFQAILNAGMVLCLLPVIGVTLPFFSAGGSSLLTTFINIGLVLSVYIHNQKRMPFLPLDQ